MATTRPLNTCLRSTRHERIYNITNLPIRSVSTTAEPPSKQPTPPPASTDRAASKQQNANSPETLNSPRSERRLLRILNQYPIGSRRRRAALASSSRIPFTKLPYQCFQEARKVLQEDRREKVADIEKMNARMNNLSATSVPPEKEAEKEQRLRSMRNKLAETKILADINDPLVKKKFEDGEGDMNKPIYRHLADLQWRTYKRKVLMQRITQMDVVPDVLPSIDPTLSTTITFAGRKVPHGDFVDSRSSELPPTLTLQPYDKGERLVTIAVVTPDIPNVKKDGFDYRCHFLAANVKISPTDTFVDLAALDADKQVIHPWSPPYTQKGIAYQRHAIFILEQRPQGESSDATISPDEAKKNDKVARREGFILRSLETKFRLKAVGVDMFRSKWDEGTAGVMERAGVVGSDVEFRRKRIEPLPYQRLKGERFR